MSKPDTKNAHLRDKNPKRETADVHTEEAQHLLKDPAFIRGFDAVKEGMVTEIINLKHDGSEEIKEFEAECCRVLRTLYSLRRAIAVAPQLQNLRLADFKPQEPEPETEGLENG